MSSHRNPDLRAFVAEAVNVDPARLENVRKKVNHLKEQLQRHIRDREEFALVEILNSGSVEKKTAITPLDDVDVALLLRYDNVPEDRRPNLLEYVRDLLIQVYQPKSPDDYSLGRHAVRIRFHDAKLSVDVVPLIMLEEQREYALLPTGGLEDWMLTSIPGHIRFTRKRIGEHPSYLELVRLTKWWRSQRGVHFKSFLIELLWAHQLDTKQLTGEDLGEALLGFFGYIVRTGLLEPITFKDNGQDRIPESVTGPVRVLDPVNAENNVAARIDEGRREVLVAACREAFEALAAAQTAPTAAVARAYYQRVFGPRFDRPRDTPGEATSPTPRDHVRSKIHADLRQLRILNGGFDAAAEAEHARAIALWIERDLAAVVELVYHAPDSRERILSFRYTINREGVLSTDDDPAGIPVRVVSGARFNVRVTGNDTWIAMGEEEKDGFYKELGGWGPVEPLGPNQVPWSPDRVYARGELAASRSVYCAPGG